MSWSNHINLIHGHAVKPIFLIFKYLNALIQILDKNSLGRHELFQQTDTKETFFDDGYRKIRNRKIGEILKFKIRSSHKYLLYDSILRLQLKPLIKFVNHHHFSINSTISKIQTFQHFTGFRHSWNKHEIWLKQLKIDM